MSWIEKLYQTYNNCMNESKNVDDDEKHLLPICHTTQNAQIKVYIDGYGNLCRAETVSRDKASTIIPCTEKSSSRSGNQPVNHPLFDKLQYLAGDFVKHDGEVTSGFSNDPTEPHTNYMKMLSEWCASSYKHPKVESVLNYLKKGNLIQDLVACKILFLDDNKKLSNQWNGEEKEKPEIFRLLPGGFDSKGNRKPWQSDAFVVFAVEIPGDLQSNLYTDISVRKSWADYYSSMKSKKDICFVDGKRSFIADQHSAKIRNSGDKAKLISSNDSSGFTYRGRFTSDPEACTIGFDVSQKAHNALRWLIARQGFRDGDVAIVAWAVSGVDIPDPWLNTADLFGGSVETLEPDSIVYTAQQIGTALSTMIAGYSAKLGPTDDVVVMGLDSATPGRMAITYYRELTGSDFLARVKLWHEQCAWVQKRSKGNQKRFVGAPSPRDIVVAAYGIKVDDKLKKTAIKRLLPCIIDGVPIPCDLVESAVRRGCNRLGHKQEKKNGKLFEEEWEETLGVACSIYRYNHKERGYSMALERDRKTRDYLYGRLLAVADCLEGFALSDAEKGRPTNAARLMQRFADHPCSTWRTIELALVPSRARLGGKIKKYDEEQKEIMSLFEADDFVKDTSLTGEFLLGYHTQQTELMKSSKKQEKSINEEE